MDLSRLVPNVDIGHYLIMMTKKKLSNQKEVNMNLINKLTKAVGEIKQTAESTFDNERVKIVSISKLKFDEDFKGLFEQEPEKVERITENMKQNGFDKSQPIIVTPDWKILDGNSRYLAAKKANIEYVPVVVKVFNS